jgi:hypothetical protein
MTTISDLLAVLSDPLAEIELRRRLAREAYERAAADVRERSLAEGYLLAVEDIKGAQHDVYRDALLEARRWHVCCVRCRRRGHREGCPDCEDRNRETFGCPVDDESPAELVARARESWAPLGLVPADKVYLAGKVVHRHSPCAAACDYPADWYTPGEAAAILARLPGDCRDAIDELQRKAAVQGRRVA